MGNLREMLLAHRREMPEVSSEVLLKLRDHLAQNKLIVVSEFPDGMIVRNRGWDCRIHIHTDGICSVTFTPKTRIGNRHDVKTPSVCSFDEVAGIIRDQTELEPILRDSQKVLEIIEVLDPTKRKGTSYSMHRNDAARAAWENRKT